MRRPSPNDLGASFDRSSCRASSSAIDFRTGAEASDCRVSRWRRRPRLGSCLHHAPAAASALLYDLTSRCTASLGRSPLQEGRLWIELMGAIFMAQQFLENVSATPPSKRCGDLPAAFLRSSSLHVRPEAGRAQRAPADVLFGYFFRLFVSSPCLCSGAKGRLLAGRAGYALMGSVGSPDPASRP